MRERGQRTPQPPRSALRALLPPDVDVRHPPRHSAAVPVWYGVVWSRLGRAELAWACWDRIHLPDLQPWIAAERGRVLRELGLHAEAERIEWPSLLEAHDPVDEAMLRISLVADAVGQGDLTRAQRRLTTTRDAVAALPDGPRAARQRLRLSWVDVEVAALAGDPLPTDGLPRWDATTSTPALPPDYQHGSVFHRAKGLLFAAIARDDPRLLEVAAEVAPPVLAWAVHLARADRGSAGALDAARVAWQQIVPPPGYAAHMAATAVAHRLAPG